MVFNSIEYLVFLLCIYLLYWFVFPKLKHQNILLFAAGYFFYGYWDYRFLLLLLLSTGIDYYFGLWIYRNKGKRKRLYLILSVINNLLILGIFKYFNFFSAEFAHLLGYFGFQVQPYILDLVLPIGISFYTFHGMSYVFDIYREKFIPVTSFINYAVFVCFFPLLVAGPIERATHLLPQIEKSRVFSYSQSVQGLRLMIWGFFKKIVIADSLAPFVKDHFENYQNYGGSTLLLGAVYFAFQIYGDFSGYTDIALGTAKLFGIELLTNFKFPYFSRNIAEFWRRWHISLSSWFRDYLYIPLGGSREGTIKSIRNIFIIFLVSGFWHGAKWNFIVWGGLHAVGFLPLFILKRNRQHMDHVVAYNKVLPGFAELMQMFITFGLVTLAWIFFRADSLPHAWEYLKYLRHGMLSKPTDYMPLFYYVIPLIFIEWFLRRDERNLRVPGNTLLRRCIYFILVFLIIYKYLAHIQVKIDFIYFQF